MERNKLGRFVKGQHANIATEFKKGKHCGEIHPNWKGGRRKTVQGYIMVYAPNHPRAYRNEVYEHVLVAEKKLGRYLTPNEVVHHINRIKDDNREENIIIFPNNGPHMNSHILETWSRKYNKCRKCGSSKREHEGRGLCGNCYKYCQYHKKLCGY